MTTRDETLVPLARAAELTGLSYNTLYGAGLRGHIRLRRMGRRILIPVADLEAFIAGWGAPRTAQPPSQDRA